MQMTRTTWFGEGTRLNGRSLFFARFCWLLFSGACIVLWLGSLVVYTTFDDPCQIPTVCQIFFRIAPTLLDNLNLSFNTIISFQVWGWIGLLPLGYILIASVLFWHKSDDWLAMLVSFCLISLSTLILTTLGFVLREMEPIRLLAHLLMFLSYTAYGLLLSVFPNGRSVPKWFWWASFIIAGLAITSLEDIALITLLVIGFSVQIYRFWWVSTPNEQQQAKWVLLGIGLISLYILYFYLTGLDPLDSQIEVIGLFIETIIMLPILWLFPLALAFSIMRYRLWEIDFLINRSLVYGGLLTILGGSILGILLVSSWLAQLWGVGQWGTVLLVLTAVLIGTTFQPIRLKLQQFVDERLYDIHINYQKSALVSQAPIPQPPVIAQTQYHHLKNLQLIGRGGMAEVYKAEHPSLNVPVAVKKMLPHDDASFTKRFAREAQTLQTLNHPHIVKLYEFGQVDETGYMVMEYIDGLTLRDYLRQHAPLTPLQAEPILRQLASALDEAHTQGVIHRDVKPSNIMLHTLPDGTIRTVLTDFGIAKLMTQATRYTQTGGVVGTFDYISPEQIQAKEELDGRCDQYAFAILTYQMLVGHLPYQQQNAGALLIAHMSQPLPDPREQIPNFPRHAVYALQKAASKEPNGRYPTLTAFVDDLFQHHYSPA